MDGLIPFSRGFGLFDAMSDFERSFFRDGTPVNMCRTDIREEDGRYITETELPGFSKDDIAIDINGKSLTLKAERRSEDSEKNQNGRYIRRERSYGSYQRTFDISGIDAEKISAEYKNGILTLNLPKKQQQVSEARRLQING